MERMKMMVATVLFLAIAFCFFGCARKTVSEDYRDSPFSARIVLCGEGGEFEALLRVGNESEGERDIRIELIAPDTLSGITIYREKGEIYAEYGDLRLSGTAFSHILESAGLVLPEGELSPIDRMTVNGRDIIRASVPSGCEIYLDAETCAPVEIRYLGSSVKFKEFKRIAE